MFRRGLSLCALLIATSPACGTSNKTVGSGKTKPIPQGDAGGVCTAGSTCTCLESGALGETTCSDEGVAACVCAPIFAMDGGGGGGGGGGCKAGYYTGNFSGTYHPAATGSFPVPISAKELNGVPGLAMTLTQDSGGEFASVGNGCLIGNAEGFGTDNPFIAILTGSVDCSSGEFKGEIVGYYNLVNISVFKPTFHGPLTGKFDADAKLNDGKWTVTEDEAGLGGFGGDGTWTVSWTSENGPNELPEACKKLLDGTSGVMFPDGGAP